MSGLYLSKVLPLPAFEIDKVSGAVLVYEGTTDVSFDVSVDGGKTFKKNVVPNRRFRLKSDGLFIVVRIRFPKEYEEEYLVDFAGSIPLADAGTTVYFRNKQTSKEYTTTIGKAGSYLIRIPPGLYQIYYILNGQKTVVIDNIRPDTSVIPVTQRLDKVNAIQLKLSGFDWVNAVVYDTFDSVDKIDTRSNTLIDSNGDLRDGESSAKVEYWALGLEANG